MEIELVNAGKSPALLVKVEELLPEGFELIERPKFSMWKTVILT